MDVTPQLIEQFDFAEKFRGYDPDQVDDFLERVGATLTRLNDELRAQVDRADRAEAALAEARAELRSASQAPAPQQTDEVEAATSTLVLAKRTADAAVNEARAEASKLLADARAEAERFVIEAGNKRDEMMREAREKAESEFAGQAESRRTEISDLDATKQQLGDDIAALESRFEQYRAALADVHARIGEVLDDPESLRTKAPLDVDMSPASPPPSPFYSTSSTPAVTAEPVHSDEISVVTDADASEESTSGDPWGPGSWSEVSAALGDDEGEATVATEAASPSGDVFRPASPAEESVATSGEETGDKYLQDLHDAVNGEPDVEDPAMDEFFDGRQERPRRFGRRH